mmetsp:Transcript_35296/g.54043  ORF Transcript_35296/g.54043 Transcript_35296/m.54043 type:complete len:88 (-) Transcript_35296:498-761(-)
MNISKADESNESDQEQMLSKMLTIQDNTKSENLNTSCIDQVNDKNPNEAKSLGLKPNCVPIKTLEDYHKKQIREFKILHGLPTHEDE